MTGKKSMQRWPRFALEDVHRFGGILVGTFLVLHIAAVAIDAYLPFSLTSLVVPLVASYRPLWTALGIVAAELLLALAFTNHYRNVSISYRFWRRAHFVNFVVWGAATLHGLGSGTDRSSSWLLAVYAAAVATVCALTTWRVLRRWRPSPVLLRVAPVAAAVLGVAFIGALARGPLRFQPKEWNAAVFSDTLDGRIITDAGVTRGIVSMAGNGSGSQRVLVRADLLVAPQRLAVDGVPDGVPAERLALHGHRDPGARLELPGHLPHARRERPIRRRTLATEQGWDRRRWGDHRPRVMSTTERTGP